MSPNLRTFTVKKFIHHEEHEGNEEKDYKINNLILHALHGYFVILNTFTASPAWERRPGSASFLRPTQPPQILNQPRLARSLVQSFLIVGKLELPEQVTQAGAWVTAYFSFCDYD